MIRFYLYIIAMVFTGPAMATEISILSPGVRPGGIISRPYAGSSNSLSRCPAILATGNTDPSSGLRATACVTNMSTNASTCTSISPGTTFALSGCLPNDANANYEVAISGITNTSSSAIKYQFGLGYTGSPSLYYSATVSVPAAATCTADVPPTVSLGNGNITSAAIHSTSGYVQSGAFTIPFTCSNSGASLTFKSDKTESSQFYLGDDVLMSITNNGKQVAPATAFKPSSDSYDITLNSAGATAPIAGPKSAELTVTISIE